MWSSGVQRWTDTAAAKAALGRGCAPKPGAGESHDQSGRVDGREGAGLLGDGRPWAPEAANGSPCCLSFWILMLEMWIFMNLLIFNVGN